MRGLNVLTRLVKDWNSLSESQRQRIFQLIQLDQVADPNNITARLRFVQYQLHLPGFKPERTWSWIGEVIDYARPRVIGAIRRTRRYEISIPIFVSGYIAEPVTAEDRRLAMIKGATAYIFLLMVCVTWSLGGYHQIYLTFLRSMGPVTYPALHDAATLMALLVEWGMPLAMAANYGQTFLFQMKKALIG